MPFKPSAEQTGLDLVSFPTIAWYETEFSVFQSTEKAAVLVGHRTRSTVGSAGLDQPNPTLVWHTCTDSRLAARGRDQP